MPGASACGVEHREVVSASPSVLGKYPLRAWSEVARPLSSRAVGPVVAMSVSAEGSHVACGFGDGTVEVWDWTTVLVLCGTLSAAQVERKAERSSDKDEGAAPGGGDALMRNEEDGDDDDEEDDEEEEDESYDAEDYVSSDDDDGDGGGDDDLDLSVSQVEWSRNARTLAVAYASPSLGVFVSCWGVVDGCSGARAPRVARRFGDLEDCGAVAVSGEAADAAAFVGATPEGGAALYVLDGVSGSKRKTAFQRIDDDGEDDDATWAVAFALSEDASGEALVAVAPTFACHVFARLQATGAWGLVATLDWTGYAAAGAPRGYRCEPAVAAAGGVVVLCGGATVDVYRAPDVAAGTAVAPVASLGATTLGSARAARGAAPLCWSSVAVGAVDGRAVVLATLGNPPHTGGGAKARDLPAGDSRVFCWRADGDTLEPEVLEAAIPPALIPSGVAAPKTATGTVEAPPPPTLTRVALRSFGPRGRTRAMVVALDGTGALRAKGPAFKTSWAGAMFPVGYELLHDNDHYDEREDEPDFVDDVEQVPTYETDLKTVDGFFTAPLLDGDAVDVLNVDPARGAALPPRPYASPLTLSGRVARPRDARADADAGDARLANAANDTVAKFRALLC